MTNDEPSRLDRIELSISSLVGVMAGFREEMVNLRTDIHEDLSAMSNAIRVLAEEGQRDREDIRIMQTEIRTMQTEIRGLQLESRRILDHLLNQQQGGD